MAVREPAPASASRPISPQMVFGIAAVIFAAYLPLLFIHFQQLWLKPHYQLYPLVLAGTFILLWPLDHFSYKKAPGGLPYALALALGGVALVAIGMLIDLAGLPALGSPAIWVAAGGVAMFAALPLTIFTGYGAVSAVSSSSPRGMIGAIAAWLLLAIAVFFDSPVGATASAIGLTATLTFTAGGWPLLRRCLPALLYLFLIVPPPFTIDTIVVQKLQVFASQLSSKILDQVGVYHNLNGVIIEIGEKRYEVEQACSGISSLLSTMACVLFYAIYFRLHWLRGIFLTLFSLLWVILTNVVRIISCTYFGSRWEIELSKGFAHTMFGIVLFGITLLLIWSADRLLMFFGRSDPTRRRYDPITIPAETARIGTNTLLNLSGAYYRSLPVATLFGVLFAAQIAEKIAVARLVPYSGSALSKLYSNLDVALLPESVRQWQRPKEVIAVKRETGNPLGEYSQVWIYKRNQGAMWCEVSLDYPYPEYHDLRVCYNNDGWQLGETRKFRHKTSDGRPELFCVSVQLARPVERYAYLWFCEFDQDGGALDPVSLGPLTDDSMGERISNRFAFAATRWQRIFMKNSTEASTGLGSVLQVQLLFKTKQKKEEKELEGIQELFLKSAESLRAKCVELKSAKN